MAQALYIQQELQEIAPSLIGLNGNMFTVPKDYFFGLEDAGLQLVKQSTMQKVGTEYTLPKGYFEGLSSQILQKIKQKTLPYSDELKDIAPTLASMPKVNVYNVPQNYFDSLNLQVPKAKIISIKRVIQYSSAAAVIIFLSVAGFKVFQSNSIKKEHVVAKQTNIEKSVENISLEELQKGVNNTVAFNNPTVEPVNIESQKLFNVDETLEIVSDEELENYLKQNIVAEETIEGAL
jgi:hypothetical protein